MSFDHREHVVAITGAGGGIGRATAVRLATDGASIAVWDIDQDAANATADAVVAAGSRALVSLVDVRDREGIKAGIADTERELGPITRLVNNAGLVTMSGLDELTEAEWDLVLDVNLKGMWLVTQEVSRVMPPGGAIVNLSTVESQVVVSSTGSAQVHYNASKGGVPMLTKALAVELASRSIRVNAVAPGPVATDFVDLEGITSDDAFEFMSQRLLIPRVGQPEDIAAAISFLLSDDAAWITGIQLPVDGGWLTR